MTDESEQTLEDASRETNPRQHVRKLLGKRAAHIPAFTKIALKNNPTLGRPVMSQDPLSSQACSQPRKVKPK